VLMVGRDLLGTSPGKHLMGFRLANRDDLQAVPNLARRLRRNLIFLVAPLGLPIESLVLAYNPFLERVGDRWAKTDVVVRRGHQRREEVQA
jgi:uncharacterized RDD family membrane protein YckC